MKKSKLKILFLMSASFMVVTLQAWALLDVTFNTLDVEYAYQKYDINWSLGVELMPADPNSATKLVQIEDAMASCCWFVSKNFDEIGINDPRTAFGAIYVIPYDNKQTADSHGNKYLPESLRPLNAKNIKKNTRDFRGKTIEVDILYGANVDNIVSRQIGAIERGVCEARVVFDNFAVYIICDEDHFDQALNNLTLNKEVACTSEIVFGSSKYPGIQITAENTTVSIGNITYIAQTTVALASFGSKHVKGKIIVSGNNSNNFDIPDAYSGPKLAIGQNDMAYPYWDESAQVVNKSAGFGLIADLMYFPNGAPSLVDMAKAAVWSFETGTHQKPANMREAIFGGYPAIMEDISNPLTGTPGYLVQVRIDRDAVYCLLADVANWNEISGTIEFGGL